MINWKQKHSLISLVQEISMSLWLTNTPLTLEDLQKQINKYYTLELKIRHFKDLKVFCYLKNSKKAELFYEHNNYFKIILI